MLKKIEMILTGEEDADVNAMSIVNDPANAQLFVKLSTDKSKLKMSIDEEKQTVTAPVLIPYQLIYRNKDFYLGECEVFFSAETIEAASMDFMSKGNINNVTLDHRQETDGACAVESWIVLNSDNDKAKELGFDIPVGTWMMSYKVEDSELWEEIKSGKFNGFSIEANFDAIELNKQEIEKEFIELLSHLNTKEKKELENSLIN